MFISQTTDFHFANYRFPFRKLQIFISQTIDFYFANYTTDFHFANYRFSFGKLRILILQTTDFHFANYRFSFRKLQISISQTTDFHFVSSHFVSFHFVSSHFVSQNYSKPISCSTSSNNCLLLSNCSQYRPNNNIQRHCTAIHLIPKWRPINYSFVCMLISPLCLIFTLKLFCF